MRPLLTVASSLTPDLPWWRNVSLPSPMVEKAVSMVVRNIAARTPRSGVAVIIRVPRPHETPEQATGAWAQRLHPDATPAVIHHLR